MTRPNTPEKLATHTLRLWPELLQAAQALIAELEQYDGTAQLSNSDDCEYGPESAMGKLRIAIKATEAQ